ncbi:GDSL-type esterase/lipase family protein [Bauldia sp.]|uniref:SGNH/GDSL hydrolase family protein n=1 Tax=Bauldia sp. TaxID=2575872 RepID=UPI003BA92750
MVRKAFLVLSAALLGAAFVLSETQPVSAQGVQTVQEFQLAQSRKRPGLFERLFGPRKAKPRRVIRNRTPTRKRSTTVRRKRPAKRRNAAPAVQTVEVAPKDANARKILVIGDFVAGGIAWGLDQALAKEPRLLVVDRYEGASGLARNDRYDWTQEILGILNEETPDVVVVALGANDRQDVRFGTLTFPIRSSEWEALYTQRIDGLTDTLEVYGRPFFWVSAPPMRGTEAIADAAYLNGLYRPLVEEAGGHFVDVWNGFTNASGQFITTGPDIEGQNKALRTGDGVNFTSAGKRKLAYYVERDIRRATGYGSGVVDLLASVTLSSTIEIGPDGKKRLVGPILSLSDPQPGAGVELAGKPAPTFYDPITGQFRRLPAPREDDAVTPQIRLVERGEALPGVVGRIDNFTWPPVDDTGDLLAAIQPDEPETPAEASVPLPTPAVRPRPDG